MLHDQALVFPFGEWISRLDGRRGVWDCKVASPGWSNQSCVLFVYRKGSRLPIREDLDVLELPKSSVKHLSYSKISKTFLSYVMGSGRTGIRHDLQ